MKTFEKKQARFLIHTHTQKNNKILFRQSMNIDELFVANQKEGNQNLTTCFDEHTTMSCRFAPKVQAFAFVKMDLFLLPNVADCSSYIQKLLHMLWSV